MVYLVATIARSFTSEVQQAMQQRFIVLDFETTGFRSTSNRIVEIGALLYENMIPTYQFHTYVKSTVQMSSGATAVTGITDDMLKTAPTEKAVFQQFTAFLGNALTADTYVCAYNAPFDMSFLGDALKRLEYDATIQYVDALGLARKYIRNVPDHKQETIARHLGIDCGNAHSALDDAKTCGIIMLRFLNNS